ncbi:hypothetical protein GQ44DRAFT_124085 [Phaeosphaeriaceae sp. PMI808]|nr:hypothetical protein GQ44DRAFT_124085 [Phaeosphaeriaceae sp. PMI808]
MRYENILKLALAPSISFLLLSFISVVLTTHYWIAGDWLIPRGVKITTKDLDQRTKTFSIDYTIVYFRDSETNVTIASGCLCLSAAVMALIAWSTLRKPGMDTQYAAGERRFWVLAISVMTSVGAIAALTSFALHFTKMGKDEYGCSPDTLMMNGKLNTNIYCTREMAACNFQSKNIKTIGNAYQGQVNQACNEAVAVKWLQLLLMLNAVIVLAMFSVQARLRRSTRDTRTLDPYSYSKGP